MEQVSHVIDIVLLTCGTYTLLSIAHKICSLPEVDGSPQGAAHVISERAELDSAIAAGECLLTIGIKKAKFYAGYYPYLWETVLVGYSPKQRAILLFALDASITSCCYIPSRLTRQVFLWKSQYRPNQSLPIKIILRTLIVDWALNILMAAGISTVLVTVTDEIGKDKAKFAAICCGTRVLGGRYCNTE